MEFKKIAVIGLANAGKTSLIKTFIHQFDSLNDMKPTLGVARNNFVLFGTNIFLWDFGGQESYRKQYLIESDFYFESLSTVVYVIDVQDTKIFKKNLEYFKRIYDITKSIKECNLNVVFHKIDPDIKDTAEINNIQDKYKQEIQKIVSENIQINHYQTSIYDPLSIISALSISIYSNKDIHNIISTSLYELCRIYHFDFAISFSETFFEFGHYIWDKVTVEELRNLIKMYFSNYNSDSDFDAIDLYYKEYRLLSSRTNLIIRGSNIPFILVIGFKEDQIFYEKNSIKEVLHKVNLDFEKILNNVNIEELIE